MLVPSTSEKLRKIGTSQKELRRKKEEASYGRNLNRKDMMKSKKTIGKTLQPKSTKNTIKMQSKSNIKSNSK